MDYYLETQKRVRNNRGKRAIGVRAIEVLLYIAKADYFVSDNRIAIEISHHLLLCIDGDLNSLENRFYLLVHIHDEPTSDQVVFQI